MKGYNRVMIRYRESSPAGSEKSDFVLLAVAGLFFLLFVMMLVV